MVNDMDKTMPKPHEMVLLEVRRRWASERYKGIIRWLLELGQIKPLAIIIKQAESYNEESRSLSRNIINQWRYDNAGLHILSNDINVDNEQVDYCHYYIDNDKKRLVIDWSNIFPGNSSRKSLSYHHHGSVYRIIKTNGIDDFELISCWME